MSSCNRGLRRILLYVNTIRYLKVSQLGYFVWRRWLPKRSGVPAVESGGTRKDFRFKGALFSRNAEASERHLAFLNQPKRLSGRRIDWRSADMPKLWRYNLHYFDFLRQEAMSQEFAAFLIEDWIENNPAAAGDGWEAYPTSLRIVNWIKTFSEMDGVPANWLRSLHDQALWLERNLERHILANHYLKNGKALLFAGSYFDGSLAGRWMSKGVKIVEEQALEQMLPDGGHFERSAMYHSVVLEDLLDVLNLVSSNPQVASAGFTTRLQPVVRKALEFLETVRYPDGEIPLFNDAAFGIAPGPEALLAYGARVAEYRRAERTSDDRLIDLPESGFFGHRSAGDMLLMDCGPIGPDYQPGHSHCDLLSYELLLDGARVVVDSGVSDYEPGPHRRYCRGTSGHNTMRIDRLEQSEIWGVFRVARRARPRRGAVQRAADGSIGIIGAYDGYRRLFGERIRHERSIRYDGRGSWRVEDRLSGRSRHCVENFVHIHPDFNARMVPDGISIETGGGERIALIRPDPECSVSLSEGFYCPEFGVRLNNYLIVMEKNTKFPCEFHYDIEKVNN